MVNDAQPTPNLYASLTAIAARLIPDDDGSPGAGEADAAAYIVRSLAAERSGIANTYESSIAAIERRATELGDRPFAALDRGVQDAILSELEVGDAPWFGDGASAFFELVRTHVIEGTFCDPRWGGNARRVGWSLIGYRGPQPVWTREDQMIAEIPSGRS